jgi:hypothetical protein
VNLLREYVNELLLEFDACGYERSVIKALRVAGVQGHMKRAACNDANRPDADIRIGNSVFYVEVKANSHAQMGGGSVGYSLKDKRFYPVGQNRDLSTMIVDLLNQIHDTSLQKALNTLLKHLSRHAGRQFTEVPVSGFTIDSWNEVKDFGLLQAINRTFESSIDVITQHYARKDTFYVQIGGAGFFRLGEANPANLPIPVLDGRVKLELRLAKAGDVEGATTSKAGMRVQARLYAKNTSPYTLDDPESVKKMLKAKPAR